MAGYTKNVATHGNYEFHIDTPNVAERIRQANDNRRVITLQLDGDELDAALWGLEHYRKGQQENLMALHHVEGCQCKVSAACAQNTLRDNKVV